MNKYWKTAVLKPSRFMRHSAGIAAALFACATFQAAAEVVYHEDFEGDPAKWPITTIYRGQSKKNRIHVPTKEAAFGKQALYMESTDDAQWMFLMVNIPAERLHGKKLRLTAWCKSDFTGKPEIGLRNGGQYSGGNNNRVGKKTTQGNGWERIVIEGKAMPGKMTSLAVGLSYGTSGASVLIDEVTLECADEFPPLPALTAPGTNFVEMRRMRLQHRRFNALAESYKRDAALHESMDKSLLTRLVTAQKHYRDNTLTPEDAALISNCRQYALDAQLVNPSVEFSVDTLIEQKEKPAVNLLMPVNGYDAKILLLRNHSGYAQYFRPVWKAGNAPAPQLRQMIPVEGFFDAMPSLPLGGIFELPAGETKAVWIDFRSRGMKPGIYRGTLCFTPLDPAAVPELQIPVRQTVAAIKSPEELPIAVFNWDYGAGKKETDYKFLRNARVNVLHVQEPRKLKDAVKWETSNLKQVLDQVDRNGDRGKVKIFLENWFTSEADQWNRSLDDYYRQLAAYMKSRGYRYDEWIVHCFDELLNEKFLEWAKKIKQVDPQIRIFSDPPPASMEQLKPFLPYLDYFCLGSGFLDNDAKNGNKAVTLLRNTGKPLWTYHCDSQPRHSLNHYRRAALNALRQKWNGISFWSLTGLVNRHMSIHPPPPGIVNHGMSYLDENGVRYPSRRWALWELGIDNYALITALREKGVDVDKEIQAMYNTKDAVALDKMMNAFKEEKLKLFLPTGK